MTRPRVKRIVPDLHVPADTAGVLFGDVLELDRVMDLGWATAWAVPDEPRIQVLALARDASAPVAPDVSVEVDDVDAVHAAAVGRGLRIVHPLTDEPWGVRRCFVELAPGAVVNVLQHTPAGPR